MRIAFFAVLSGGERETGGAQWFAEVRMAGMVFTAAFAFSDWKTLPLARLGAAWPHGKKHSPSCGAAARRVGRISRFLAAAAEGMKSLKLASSKKVILPAPVIARGARHGRHGAANFPSICLAGRAAGRVHPGYAGGRGDKKQKYSNNTRNGKPERRGRGSNPR